MIHSDTPNNQDRTELALQASNEGVWDWFVGKKEIYYSERVLKFLGHSEPNAPNIFTQSKEIFHQEDIEGFDEALNLSLIEGSDQLFASDSRYYHPDGKWHWLRIRGVVVHDDTGKATRMVGSIIDISQRKNAEIALEEERFRLKQLIENVPVNVYYKDTESRFLLANTSTIEKLGVSSPEEVIGKTDHDFFDIHHADITRQNELRIMETRAPDLNELHRETWGHNAEKEDTWAKSSKLPWIDKKGKICGTFGITSDITDLVRTQRMLSTVAEELQQRNKAFEEELQLAREIQQALIPDCLNGLILETAETKASLACRYRPASEMAGDFYEILPISDNCVGIFLCDVMGHGVRASLVVSMLRGLMEKERDHASQPEIFLQELNDGLFSIFSRAGVTMFATAVYCVINLDEHTLHHACAGHPEPLALKGEKARKILTNGKKKSPALGLIPGASYNSELTSLNDIDRLLILTDGIHEVENEEEEEYGVENVIKQLELNATSNLNETLDALIENSLKYSQKGEFDDDVCLLAIDFTLKN